MPSTVAYAGIRVAQLQCLASLFDNLGGLYSHYLPVW